MTDQPAPWADPRHALLELYDSASREVYRYLAARCGSATVAEDLMSETFMAAVAAVERNSVPQLGVPWLIGVARHKLVDHWRRLEREQRILRAVEPVELDDRWEVQLDAVLAHQVLARLGPHHRGALTLRYLDGLPVADVAHHLGRTVEATEALLIRAKRAFRAQYDTGEPAR